jgi:hypothetical protein
MMDYWDRVRAEATRLGSDGCSGVPDFFRDACLEHDIHYRTHRNLDGREITKREADRLFRQRMQDMSVFGAYSPMSWWRWLAVTLAGGSSWRAGTTT